ncbi:MAG TPA: hypothetical protein VFS67_04550 [Polyangiaceae bacterium]|nr:hypothetical protein [Polyangiaceae bacterium]
MRLDIAHFALLALLAAATGCSSESAVAPSAPLGTLSMALATEANGIHYRLSNDVFLLNGPERRELSHNGDGAIVFAALPPGEYEMELQPGWVLEKQSDSGFEALQAELSSPNPRPFQIRSEQTTVVAWVFETDGVPLSLAPGLVQGVLEVRDSSAPSGE